MYVGESARWADLPIRLVVNDRRNITLIYKYLFFAGNVALKKPGSVPTNSTRRSNPTDTVFPASTNNPSWAVDGVTSKISEDDTCTFIEQWDPNPLWWRVDLQDEHIIYSVHYITCTDHCGKYGSVFFHIILFTLCCVYHVHILFE